MHGRSHQLIDLYSELFALQVLQRGGGQLVTFKIGRYYNTVPSIMCIGVFVANAKQVVKTGCWSPNNIKSETPAALGLGEF